MPHKYKFGSKDEELSRMNKIIKLSKEYVKRIEKIALGQEDKKDEEVI